MSVNISDNCYTLDDMAFIDKLQVLLAGETLLYYYINKIHTNPNIQMRQKHVLKSVLRQKHLLKSVLRSLSFAIILYLSFIAPSKWFSICTYLGEWLNSSFSHYFLLFNWLTKKLSKLWNRAKVIDGNWIVRLIQRSICIKFFFILLLVAVEVWQQSREHSIQCNVLSIKIMNHINCKQHT